MSGAKAGAGQTAAESTQTLIPPRYRQPTVSNAPKVPFGQSGLPRVRLRSDWNHDLVAVSQSNNVCTMCYSTHVIPFRVDFRPGVSIYEQIVYSAKKAMVSGRLIAGAAFPPVRSLSRELKVNPNTAHKVVARLITDGLLESRPGVGTVVSERVKGSVSERTALLGHEIEQLVVEAKKLGITLDDVSKAVSAHWKRLSQRNAPEKISTPEEPKRP